MQIHFTGRQVEVTPALKKFAEGKIAKLEKIIGKVIETHLILSLERKRHRAEAVVRARSVTLSGDSRAVEPKVALHGALEKVEKQARRFKEKRTGRRKRVGKSLLAQRRTVSTPGRQEDTLPQVVPSDSFLRKPITVDEAALQVHESEREFLVFRNAESQQISVIYKKRDGNLGLIEPDF
ncbi:MAG: ribosome-associated translation inhibitor RaiA [Acidobacteriota bacterium]